MKNSYLKTLVCGLIFSACERAPSAGLGADAGALVEGEPLKVVSVLKGDEVAVEKKGKNVRVRLLGIQAFSAVVEDSSLQGLSDGSTTFLQQSVLSKTVQLYFDKPLQDAGGRYLAYLHWEGVDINKRLVQEGWATVYTEYPFAREADYLAAEVLPRDQHKNIWSKPGSLKIIQGLRRQWAEARKQRGAVMANDVLIAE